jgi:hypothetical protein
VYIQDHVRLFRLMMRYHLFVVFEVVVELEVEGVQEVVYDFPHYFVDFQGSIGRSFEEEVGCP